MKYYVSDIQLEAEYNTRFNFGGLYSYDKDGDDCSLAEDEQECYRLSEQVYKTSVILSGGSISVAQNFTVTDDGDISVDLPLITITIQKENLNIIFSPSQEDMFIMTISRILDQTKDYIIKNINQIINDNHDYIKQIYQKGAQIFTELDIKINDDYRVKTKFQTVQETNFNFNPYISSNYISGFQRIEIEKEARVLNQRF